ncbi:MAG TPA: 2-oxoglutarate dehydrogenase complex dihydrolipoyllysine-residue succinyltransferase [Pseudomonadales bacterium]|nr:2-oxoglutarate dehydrogenase complex dihydrolipoyllysine-residue succinyltransferase [Pseudomonadales bacterium]
MTVEIKAPTFPESIADGTVAAWHKQPGEAAKRDDVLVEIETDKVVLEIVAPADGTLQQIVKAVGDVVLSEEVVGLFAEGATAAAAPAPARAAAATAKPAAEPAIKAALEREAASVSPAARKLAAEQGVVLGRVDGTGKDGRVTKEDVLRAAAQKPARTPGPPVATITPPSPPVSSDVRAERRVPMSRLRASIARRLVEAQHTAAMLTTFNEVDMQAVMTLRSRHKDEFEKRHNGIRLGFMSFFVRASVEALKRFPAVNASIDETDIVYHGYYDIGVAVSTDRGLVVPVIRDADALGLAQIEEQIRVYGTKARDGKLTIEDMSGGTFTISNGGVFGSLMSTPILNAPQTAVLGMHKIQERPVVLDGQIVARPMMYLALSYDHRLIDGQEAVRFLVTIKELLEDPARILLDL